MSVKNEVARDFGDEKPENTKRLNPMMPVYEKIAEAWDMGYSEKQITAKYGYSRGVIFYARKVVARNKFKDGTSGVL